MQLILALGQIVKSAPTHAFYAEGDPFIEQLFHTQHARHSGDQHIEVAGKRILQRRDTEKLLHELLRVYAALEINGQLHTGKAGFIAHIADLTNHAGLDAGR